MPVVRKLCTVKLSLAIGIQCSVWRSVTLGNTAGKTGVITILTFWGMIQQESTEPDDISNPKILLLLFYDYNTDVCLQLKMGI